MINIIAIAISIALLVGSLRIIQLEKEVERLDEIRTGISKDYYIVGYKDCELDKTQQYPISSQDVWRRNVVHINELK